MNEIILALTVTEIGQKHPQITCPYCDYNSKPYGLGKQSKDKIQLVRKCRSCNKLFWYWINRDVALTSFRES